ncbi:MAG TPA: aminotransferase class V-fold PLP-dependent enzyme [Caldilineaceae bacterium]|nr:aminotransferase class V-fold PLP-dependent enzyme [Caldilineaceae bacterium]
MSTATSSTGSKNIYTNIYEELGIRPLINASATLTRLGGSIMPPEVVQAMVEASKHFVNLDELQRAVGERLAELTHNEAAYVSAGAAAGIVLATAACITGTDPKAIQQLPDLTGLKNEVIIHKSHRNGYDHAVRQVGVKVVEIGFATHTAPWELERAINDKTAAIFWFQGAMTGRGDLPLETVIEIANRYNVPVVVDATAQLPPVENLWRFTQMGAALAIFSGGKDLRGPQASGLVVGRKDLIEAIRLNGNPNHSIGRPMKVGKEEMVGLLTAVKLYLQRDHEARASQEEEVVAGWCAALNRIDGVRAERVFPNEAGQPLPRAKVVIDPAKTGLSRDQVVEQLMNGSPSIHVALAGADGLYLNPMTLADGEEQIVLDRLTAILRG